MTKTTLLDPTGEHEVVARKKAPKPIALDGITVGVLDIGKLRGDVFLEQLHSGEVFGGPSWVLLSDAAAVALVVTLVTGYWLWLAPKRGRGAPTRAAAASPGPLR